MVKIKDNALEAFLQAGIKVIPCWPNSPATKGSWKDGYREDFTSDVEKVRQLQSDGINRFMIHPWFEGLVVVDIDRKNGKDGLAELQKIDGLPWYVKSVEHHPARTHTPSNGYHLYFRDFSRIKYKPEINLRPGIDIASYNHLVAAPGSYKNGNPYVFVGDIAKAPPLPEAIRKLLTPYVEWVKIRMPISANSATLADFERMCKVLVHQGHVFDDARNSFAFEFGKYARNKGIDIEQTTEFVIEKYEESGFYSTEIERTVKSAYEGWRR